MFYRSPDPAFRVILSVSEGSSQYRRGKRFFVTAFLRMTYAEDVPEKIQDFYPVFE